jgi:hypothetical protein
MPTRRLVKLLLTSILVVIATYSVWASFRQPLWQWQGLTHGIDRWWTIATLLDAYCGFLIFYVWVHCRERTAPARVTWFVAIMLLGNMATALYALRQIRSLGADEPLSALFARSS